MGAAILIVDDEAVIRSFLAEVLSDEGYVVRTAPNGMEALGMVREHIPDAILSDIMMPVLDGLSLCHRVQSDPAISHVPIILMSAVVQLISPDVCACHAFVRKPINLNDLLHTLAEVLERG